MMIVDGEVMDCNGQLQYITNMDQLVHFRIKKSHGVLSIRSMAFLCKLVLYSSSVFSDGGACGSSKKLKCTLP